MAFAFRGAEKDKLVQIIHDARFAQDGAGEYAARRAADGQAIGPAEYVIGGFSPPPPSINSIRMVGCPGICFFRYGINALTRIPDSSRSAAANQSNGLSLINGARKLARPVPARRLGQ